MGYSGERTNFIVASMVLMLAILVCAANAEAANADASVPKKINISKDIYTLNGELVFSGSVAIGASLKRQKITAIEKRIPLGNRYLLGTSKFHKNDYVALSHPRSPGELTIDIFDATGKQVSKLDLPRMKSPILLEKSIMVTPVALHAVGTPHDLEFYSWEGKLLNKVSVPHLVLMNSYPQPGGQLATVSQGTVKSESIIRIYSPKGNLLWHYVWASGGYPNVKVTPDNSRIIITSQVELISEITILDSGNKLVGQHKIDGVSGVSVAADSQSLAVASRSGLFLVDLASGNTLWKKPGGFYAVHDGIQFDKKTGDLNVVHVEVVNSAEYSLHVQKFGLKGGKAKKADLGIISRFDQNYQIIDISDDVQGATHITFSHESRTINPGAWKNQ